MPNFAAFSRISAYFRLFLGLFHFLMTGVISPPKATAQS